jgi:RNA-directed DNA polymerase
MSQLPGTITPARPENPANPETSRQEGQYEITVPVLMDRCHQARAKNALEPEWEARFEPRSYGFRPGRSCQDAIEAIYDTCKGRTATRVWTLDADLASAFDTLGHSHLMSAIGSFPGREMIRAWLKAGVFEPN